MSPHDSLVFSTLYFITKIIFCNTYRHQFVTFYKEDKCTGISHRWTNMTNDETVFVPTDSWMFNETRSILYFGKWSAHVGIVLFKNMTEENAYDDIYNYTVDYDKEFPYCEDFDSRILQNDVLIFISVQGNLSEEVTTFGFEMFLYSTLKHSYSSEEPVDLVYVNITGHEIIPPRYFKRFVLFSTSVWTLYEENGYVGNYQCLRYNLPAELSGSNRVTYIEKNVRLKVGSIHAGCAKDATTQRPPPISNSQDPSANLFLAAENVLQLIIAFIGYVYF